MNEQQRALAKAVRSAIEQVGVALLGRVLSYDPTDQSLSVQPMPANSVEGQLPPVDHVPVVFPTGGGFSITWPLVAGDVVLLVTPDWAIDQWLASEAEVAPQDQRSHDLTDVIAIPAMSSFKSPRDNASGTALRIVKDGSTVFEVNASGTVFVGGTVGSDAIALASLVQAELASLWTAFNAHSHLAPSGGGATGNPSTGTPPTPAGSAGSVASTNSEAV